MPSVRGDLLLKLGRLEEARVEFERAASLTQNAREREMLLDRARACAKQASLRSSPGRAIAKRIAISGTKRRKPPPAVGDENQQQARDQRQQRRRPGLFCSVITVAPIMMITRQAAASGVRPV